MFDSTETADHKDIYIYHILPQIGPSSQINALPFLVHVQDAGTMYQCNFLAARTGAFTDPHEGLAL